MFLAASLCCLFPWIERCRLARRDAQVSLWQALLLFSWDWVFAHGGESQPSLNHVFLLSAAPPSHPACTQRVSVLEGGTSVPELCNVSVGSSWLLRTSSSSLIVLPFCASCSSSSCFWPRREHQPVSQMLSWPTHNN